MSEDAAPYRVSYATPAAARCALDHEIQRLSVGASYRAPEPSLIRAFMDTQGLTQMELAHMLRVDVATVRRWTRDRGSETHRPIPFAAWGLLLCFAGHADPSRLPLWRRVSEARGS